MPRERIIIIGSGGMLGRSLVDACRRRRAEPLTFADRSALDITNADAVREALSDADANVIIINAAAFTDVDGAEAQPEAAEAGNATGPANLAALCRDTGALLVHYSTDYVFNGRGTEPFAVNAPTGPLNTYGRTKLLGERAIVRSTCPHLILRTSWLFAPHGRNFVRTIHRAATEREELHVVNDQVGRPTHTDDLADATLALLDHSARGTLHFANDGRCSWFEFAAETVRQAGLSCTVHPCGTERFPRPATRPGNSVLDLSATIDLIGTPRPWQEALRDCLAVMERADVESEAG